MGNILQIKPRWPKQTWHQVFIFSAVWINAFVSMKLYSSSGIYSDQAVMIFDNKTAADNDEQWWNILFWRSRMMLAVFARSASVSAWSPLNKRNRRSSRRRRRDRRSRRRKSSWPPLNPRPISPTLLFPKQCTANTTFALGPIKRLTNHNQKNQQINKLLKLWRHNSFEKNLQHNFQNSGEGAAGVHPSLKILKKSLWIWFAILPYQVGHQYHGWLCYDEDKKYSS